MFKRLKAYICLVLVLCILTACGKEKEVAEPKYTYKGVLTNVKIGMSLNKVVALTKGIHSNVDIYAEDDDTLWCVCNDTHLAKLKETADLDSPYYMDDTLITYYFVDKDNSYKALNGYVEELYCFLDENELYDFYIELQQAFKDIYEVEPKNIKSVMTGCKGVDYSILYETTMVSDSFDIKLTMTTHYELDKSQDLEGYFGDFLSISLKYNK